MGLFQHLSNSLLTMTDAHLNTILIVYVLSQVLRTVYRTMLAAGTSEREHQRGETALHVALNVVVGKLIHTI